MDPTGRRWRRLRLLAVAVAVTVVAVTVAAVPRTLDAASAGESLPGARSVSLPAGVRLTVVGSGPLVRVVRVVGNGSSVRLRDAVTNVDVGPLPPEAAGAAGSAYLLQRYGYAPGLSRTISLTFDDGPDPRFTGRLLDLLSRNHVAATFFVIGSSVVRYPELVAREHREGHLVAPHSLTHADLSTNADWQTDFQLVWPRRIVRAVAGVDPSLVRLPYEGDDVESTQDGLVGVERAQRLGLVVASHDFDTDDWESPRVHNADRLRIPPLDGRNWTVLLHDGGGDRAPTLAYVEQLIRQAKLAGYTFTTMATAQAGLIPDATTPAVASTWDRVTVEITSGVFDWPTHVLWLLLALAFVSIVASVWNCCVAVARRIRRRRLTPGAGPPVRAGVVIAAYNEERVVERTVRAALASTYPLMEVLVVDDGSTDGTLEVLQRLAASEPRLRVLTQPNRGKAAALNHALATTVCDVAVTMDADTVVEPSTAGYLLRHFEADDEGRLGAVAGVIRVGNRRRNLLTRWQALEYVTQIGVDRAAQAALGAVVVVPGACAAWRVDAVLAARGYSDATLAEDNDLTLTLQTAGWGIQQDDDAVAWTEAPEDVDALLAQRIRWTYGTLQSIWKHRRLLGRHGWLGRFVLPMYVASIVLPLIFLPLTVTSTVLLVGREDWTLVAWSAVLFLGSQALCSAVAVVLLRESPRMLAMVLVYRFVFEPLRAYLLYTSVLMALRGVRAGWNKLARTGRLEAAPVSAAAVAALVAPGDAL